MDTLIYVLLGLTSVVGLAFIVERALTLRWQKVVPAEITALLAACNSRADVQTLCRVCEQKPSPLGRLLLLASDHLDWPKDDNVDALQTAARHEIVRLERGLVVLEIIVGIAPLLGLVGTIIGMMTVFGDIGQAGLNDAAKLAARHCVDFAGDAHRPAHRHPVADLLELFQQKSRGVRCRDGGALRRLHPAAVQRIRSGRPRSGIPNPKSPVAICPGRQTLDPRPHHTCASSSANAAPRRPSSSSR